MEVFICEWRDETVAHFQTSRHIGVRRIRQNYKGEQHVCCCNYQDGYKNSGVCKFFRFRAGGVLSSFSLWLIHCIY